jgi:hypothetical protein
MVIFPCFGIVHAEDWILSVSPASRSVAKNAITTFFTVSNTSPGAIPMNWNAAVTEGGTWLTISGTSGVNTGTITCNFQVSTDLLSRTATIRVATSGGGIGPMQAANVTVTQAGTSEQPMLLVSPASRDVGKDAGTTTFSVSNVGGGSMFWVAQVTSRSSWLQIQSGSGTNEGTITCSFDANTGTSSRTGTIQVLAPGGATESPKDVTVTQTGTPEPQHVLSVTPASRDVAKDAGTTFFSVSNTGTGTMNWVAQVISGSSWLDITTGFSGTNAGNINCAFSANSDTTTRTGAIRITASGATGSPVEVSVIQAGNITPVLIGSNSIDAMDMVKITDMSGSLPAAGGAVSVRAWAENGNEISAGAASPLTISNHGTTSIPGADIESRFPGGSPAAYVFSVESSKMFITNVNNSIDGAVKVPISYSKGLGNFVSNSIGPRNTLKVTDMSGTIAISGTAITVTAWGASGNAIPESASAAALKLYSHGTTILSGASLAARFPSGTPLTYEFVIGSPKLVISNVKNSSDGTLNIPTVYSIGVSSFVANTIGSQNTIYISDFSGTLGTSGAAITVKAWDVSGTEIPESESVTSYNIANYETLMITGSELASRFSSGSPMTYEFTVGSSKVVITNVKSSSDGGINIPTVYTSGILNYTTNYVSDLTTIQITDMSGGIPSAGASITIIARDMDGNMIPESAGVAALTLYNHGTTTIGGEELRNRFLSGVPVTYEFTIGSPIALVTALTNSSDATIRIPSVFTIGSYGGI